MSCGNNLTLAGAVVGLNYWLFGITTDVGVAVGVFFLLANNTTIITKTNNNTKTKTKTTWKAAISFGSIFIATNLVCMLVTLLLLGPVEWTSKVIWEMVLGMGRGLASPTTPNISLFWYFITQIFTDYRQIYTTTFFVLPLIFITPLGLRLHKFPLTYIFALLGLGIVDGSQSGGLATVGYFTIVMLSAPLTFRRLRWERVGVAVVVLGVTSCLWAVDLYLWVGTGGGNANYVYFQGLGFVGGVGVLVVEGVRAGVGRGKMLELWRRRGEEVEVEVEEEGSVAP